LRLNRIDITLKTSENFVASNNGNDLHKVGSRKINTLQSFPKFSGINY